ncbi:AAA family ATPase [Nocardioides sp. BP30]|uniref:AAA family ATPase n=1 Tax=Nocardioides sp. BP30 TaxID=3036374 RepID=UPI00246836DF|nr:AAA family ATPase [Nocardioides sp. BP30]WGL53811.1 AAA family ATPase [Nocardioides sp. BP30]
MPVVVEADQQVAAGLLRSLPSGTQAVPDTERMRAWMAQHPDEYVVVLGPTMPLPDALAACEGLRVTRPAASVVLARAEVSAEVFAQAVAAGAREVIPAGSPEAVSEAAERAYRLFTALRGAAAVGPSEGKVLTVWSPKGGVGKTTMAVNLGLALAEKGARRVCVVDLDLAFGDVAITMQLFPTHSIEHAVGSEDAIDTELLEGLLTRHHDAMMVLAAPSHPDVRDRISATLVSQVIRTLKQTFDYVVVDTAPAFDEQTLTALDETDDIVVVATLDVPTLKNVKVALETLDMLDIASDHRHLLLNRADDEVGISADRVEGILGMRPRARVASSIEIAAATNAGKPIVLRDPHHPTSLAIRELASLLAGQSVGPPAGVSTATRTAPQQRGFRWKRR